MNNEKVNWSGNFPAVVTPFTKNGDIDGPRYLENIERMLSEGANGIIVSGSTGEAWSLTMEERLELNRMTLQVVGKRVPVLVGTGRISTTEVIELTRQVKADGAEGVMVIPPYYAGLNRRAVVEHYRAISQHAQTPILLYNSPAATNVNLTADFCEELAEIDYVVGIKQSCDDFVQFQETVASVGEQIIVFTGHSSQRGYAAVLMGAKGFVSSQETQVMGREGFLLYEHAAAGRHDEARSVQFRSLALSKALDSVGSEPASVKAAMNMLGRGGGYVRKPVLDLSESEMHQLAESLDRLGLEKK